MINKIEKKLLRKYLSELDINIYKITNDEQKNHYKSIGFQLILDGYYALEKAKKEAKKINKREQQVIINKMQRKIRIKLFFKQYKIIIYCLLISLISVILFGFFYI